MTRPSKSVAPPRRLGRAHVGKQKAEPPGATPTDVVRPRPFADTLSRGSSPKVLPVLEFEMGEQEAEAQRATPSKRGPFSPADGLLRLPRSGQPRAESAR